MEVLLFIVMIVLGLVGSFFSGLLGIGGAIINYPLLLYVPALFGVARFTAHEVSSISMFQVLFASLAGVLAFRKKNKAGPSVVHKGLVMDMGSGILAGSLIGGFVSGMLQGDIINLMYGILAVAAVFLCCSRAEEPKSRRTIFDLIKRLRSVPLSSWVWSQGS